MESHSFSIIFLIHTAYHFILHLCKMQIIQGVHIYVWNMFCCKEKIVLAAIYI